MDPLLLAYLTYTAILVVTPGSTTAVVVRNTLAGGRGAGLAAAAGAALGNTSHAAAAGLGLTMVLARWPLAMSGLRVAGALYLAWLGLVSMYRVARHADGGIRFSSDQTHPPSLAQTPARASAGQAPAYPTSIRQGLTINLLNPAIATFYLVVVPSFLPAGAPRWYFAVLAALHIVMAFTCHGVWALGLDRLRRLFHPPLARRGLEALTAVALLALAVRVLLGA
jgi:threonine/homoserine/homoserine lactone efflux protein